MPLVDSSQWEAPAGLNAGNHAVSASTPYESTSNGGVTMKLGFVSAILPDLSLEEVFKFAAEEGYDCVEVMCWPVGKAERRYAGVTHIDVTNFSEADAAKVHELEEKTGVKVSALG